MKFPIAKLHHYYFPSAAGAKPSRFSELAELGFAGAALLGAVWNAKDPISALECALEEDMQTNWTPCPNWPFLTHC